MRKIFLVVMLMVWHSSIYAQYIKVKDQSTSEPLSYVSVFSNNPKAHVITDSEGKADITVFNNADSVIIQNMGYHTIYTSYANLQSNGFLVSMVQEVHELDEVVLSVNRFAESKSRLPQQVQVIRSKDIQFASQPTTAELLQQSGNVLVQKSQLGGGSPLIRGFEANKVLMVVDGVRMNNAIYRGGHLQNIITMDNTILDRTEIVFGPGSVVYGSDALGGVLHFHTRNPLLADSSKSQKTGANAFTRYSTAYEEKTAHLDFNIGLKKVAFLTSFTFSDFGDLRQGNIRNDFYGDWGKRKYYAARINDKDSMVVNKNPDIQKQSGYTQYDLLQKVLFRQSDNISHVLNFQYSTSSDIPRYDRLTELDSKGILKNAQWYYGPQKRLFASYQLNLKGTGLYDRAHVIAGFQDIQESRHNRSFGKSTLSHRIEKVKVYTLNADFDKLVGAHDIRYGTEVAYNDVSSSATAENIKTGEIKPTDTRYPGGRLQHENNCSLSYRCL